VLDEVGGVDLADASGAEQRDADGSSVCVHMPSASRWVCLNTILCPRSVAYRHTRHRSSLAGAQTVPSARHSTY